jgi:hypothetical protein
MKLASGVAAIVDGMSGFIERREVVLRGYGEVMAVVQLWEQSLEILWWRSACKHPSRSTGDFDTDRSQREIRRLESALQKMTANMIADQVARHLEPETSVGLPALCAERNRLAHRFLLEQADSASDGGFRPGTHAELIRLGNRFMACAESVRRTIDRFPAYDGPVPAHWPAVATRIVERAFTGQPIPRDLLRQ